MATQISKSMLEPADRAALLGGRKNVVINGNFDIWQRATTQTTSGYGSDDRWENRGAGSTKVHSQQAFTFGQVEVPGHPKFFSRTIVSSVVGTSNYIRKLQRIEGCQTLSGQTATLSFYAKTDAAKNIAVQFEQYFGTGGSPSSGVTGDVTTCTLSTTWQKFTITTNLPSVLGKTIGTDGNDSLRVNFWFDAGTDIDDRTNSLGQQSGTFDIAQVQLEACEVATPFEQRPYGAELALCQRYHQREDTPYRTMIQTNGTTAADTFYGTHLFGVQMRGAPTMTALAVAEGGTAYQGITTANIAFDREAAAGFRWSLAAINTTTIRQAAYLQWSADAEL